ncbi:MAG: hypothetical protein CTY16_09535 [Methylobacter sp.]|nr:MAG: hypothetical protein CTY16_09535 [Methylobacter sp.]
MATCVKSVRDPSDTFDLLQATTTTLESCTDYVLLTASEFTGLPTLTDIFAMPVAGDLQQMWMLGFGLPVIAYLTAWAFGVVINWFSDKEH